MELTFAARTDVGRERERNEDNFLVDRKLRLFVVCDGMGGHVAGAVASATAVNAIHEVIASGASLLQAYDDDPRSEPRRRDILSLLEHAVQRGSFKVYERATENPHERGMGTTATVLLFAGGRAFIGHVGDSRCYLLRDGAIHQMTEDHSLLADMLKSGRIKSVKEVDRRFRNAVTRAVGIHPTVEVETLDLAIIPSDRFLLCSDGLTGYAAARVLRQILSLEAEESAACDTLIQFANDAGGNDNITAVLATVRSTGHKDDDRIRQLFETVQSITLFRYLSFSEQARVLNVCYDEQLKKGDVVFRKGEAGEIAYVIVSGLVEIQVDGVFITELGPGRHFGELALIDQGARSADALISEDTWLLAIHRSAFHEILRRNPRFAVKLLWSFVRSLTSRLRVTTSELTVLKAMYHASTVEDDRNASEFLMPEDLQEMNAAPAPPPLPPSLPAGAADVPRRTVTGHMVTNAPGPGPRGQG